MPTKKSPIKILFLGTGSAFTVGRDNYHSNILVIHPNGKKLLIDCGSDIRHSLHEAGYNHHDIDDVYISHLHADHVGGLEWLGFTRMFDPHCDRPTLHISHLLVDDLWNKSLSGTMSSIEGQITNIHSYFKVDAILENKTFEWEGISFHIVQTIHIMNGYAISPCHGLFFTINDKNIYFTADTQYTPHLLTKFYEDADIIFHDCETSHSHSNVHAHFSELIALEPEIKKKIWLYHYNPGPLPHAEKDGFQGFVVKGQVFEF